MVFTILDHYYLLLEYVKLTFAGPNMGVQCSNAILFWGSEFPASLLALLLMVCLAMQEYTRALKEILQRMIPTIQQ